MLTWHSIYADARIAFGDLPDVRLSVSDGSEWVPCWTVTARAEVDGQMFQLQWYVDQRYDTERYHQHLSRDAARRWKYEVDKRQEHTTFDTETILAWARKSTISIKVNDAWRGNMWMRFDRYSNVWVSPAAYSELMRHPDMISPYSVHGPNGSFRMGAFPNYGFVPSPALPTAVSW